jgi:hypothetical protein
MTPRLLLHGQVCHRLRLLLLVRVQRLSTLVKLLVQLAQERKRSGLAR